MPSDEKNIIGHAKVLSYLSRMSNANTLSHAYVFSGPESVGKSLIARWFAEHLLCSSTSSKPCGSCDSCLHAEARTHPDVINVQKIKDEIDIDTIRLVRSRLTRRPLISAKLVAIIEDADALSHASSNALLKSLEEPPAYVVVLLVTSRPDKLLPTLRSRCTEILFHNVPFDEVRAGLEKRGIPAQRAKFLTTLSLGAPGRALILAHNESDMQEQEADYEAFLSLFEPLATHHLTTMIDSTGSGYAEEASRTRKRFFRWQIFIRDMVFEKLGLPSIGFSPVHRSAAQKHVSTKNTITLLNETVKSAQLLEKYISPKILTEHLAFHIWPGK